MEEEILEPDFAEQSMEARAMDPLLAAEMLSHKKRQDSIAAMLVEKENLERLTQLKPSEPFAYAKADLLLNFWDSVAKMDDDGFEFPDMKQTLINADLSYRKSVRSKIIDSLVKITHVLERSDGDRPRPFGFRKH